MNTSICFLLPGWISKNVGGAELQLYHISQEFLRIGWEVDVVTLKPRSKLNSSFVDNRIKYHYYSTKPIIFVGLIRVFFCLMQTNSEIYYIRTNAIILRFVAYYFTRIKRKKLVYALAGNDELEIAKTLSDLKHLKSHSIFGRMMRFIDSDILLLLFKNIGYKCDLLITQSRYQHKFLKDKFDIESIILPNVFKPTQPFLESKKDNIFIWVGNMRREKQPDKLFALLERLQLRDWKVVVIGDTGIYSDDCKKFASPEIIFTGTLSVEDTEQWFLKSKALINTSKTEGFPNTYLQSLYYGLHIFALEIDPRIFFDELCNSSFFHGNLDSMIAKLNSTIVGKDSLPSQIGTGLKLSEFTVKKYAERLIGSLG